MTTIQKKSYFDMKNLTPFEWDRMYVIRPYTSRRGMQQIVGIKWTTAKSYIDYLLLDKTWFGKYPLDDDIFHKLIFVKDDKVILDVTLKRTEVDFMQVEDTITQSDSFFIIDQSEKNTAIIKNSNEK